MMNIELLINDEIATATMEVVSKAVMWCSKEYNFDGEEALRRMNITLSAKLSTKLSTKLSSKLSSNAESKKVSKLKSRIVLPYNGEIDCLSCQGLSYNKGLYTQCQGTRLSTGLFCNNCQLSADKNNDVPEYGTIVERLKAYTQGVEFKDPSGKSPTAYAKIMQKLKVTREEVEEEAGKFNIKINPIHFEAVVVKKSGRPALKKKEEVEVKPKGRPKKAKKVLELAGDEEDLFASLVMSANKSEEKGSVSEEKGSGSEDEGIDTDADTIIMSDSEEEFHDEMITKLTAEEEAKLNLAKEEKEAKKKADEEEKESKKKAAEQEKESKKKAAEQEKEAKKKAAEQEKEAKKKAAEEEKEAKKTKKEEKETKKTKKEENKSVAVEDKKVVEVIEEEEEQDIVKRFEFEGKKYLKSKKSGIIYNMEQDMIGKWNETKQRIDFYTNDEESCDEYEE